MTNRKDSNISAQETAENKAGYPPMREKRGWRWNQSLTKSFPGKLAAIMFFTVIFIILTLTLIRIAIPVATPV